MLVLDLRSGYFQMAVNPSDIVKTAFATKIGTYAFRRMPFGLSKVDYAFSEIRDGIRLNRISSKRLIEEARRNTKAKHEKWEKYYNRHRRDVQIKRGRYNREDQFDPEKAEEGTIAPTSKSEHDQATRMPYEEVINNGKTRKAACTRKSIFLEVLVGNANYKS
ncbi:hypothetical protein TNCV_5003111 [Trichonephila clavipes]|nr:hypothetical protein TNCV_5003111 [Trichonephila clavipes]